jgi:hypothetical protein
LGLLSQCCALFQPWTSQYCHTSASSDNFSLEGIVGSPSCFHIQALAFPLEVGRKQSQTEYLNVPQCITFFKNSLLNKYEILKVCRFLINSMFHLEK